MVIPQLLILIPEVNFNLTLQCKQKVGYNFTVGSMCRVVQLLENQEATRDQCQFQWQRPLVF